MSKPTPSELAHRVGRRIREDAARRGRPITQDEASRKAAKHLSRYANKQKE